MKHFIICKNCKSENPNYALNCDKCNGYLRTRVPNIDLWATISNLITSPTKAAETIIYSEHKNFVTVIMTLIGIKLSTNYWILFNSFKNEDFYYNSFLITIALGIISFIGIVIILSFLISFLLKFIGILNRPLDVIALITFSFFPSVITLVILSPIQLALFGLHWFTFNPSPFLVKEIPSYIIAGIEGIFLCWSVLLLSSSIYVISKNKVFSIVCSFSLFIVILVALYFFLQIPI